MDLELMACPTCHRATLVEIPPCPDGHEGDCPERICIECGTAFDVGGGSLPSVNARSGGTRLLRRPRSAA